MLQAFKSLFHVRFTHCLGRRATINYQILHYAVSLSILLPVIFAEHIRI